MSEKDEDSGLSVGDIAKMGANVADPLGIARLTAASLLRAVNVITKGSVDNASDVASQFATGVPVSEILDSQIEQVRAAAMSALGVEEETQSRSQGAPRGLKRRGDELLYRSWSAAAQANREHPAFDHILSELTPDEARILRFLAVAGAQPSIDIRTNTLFGIGSQRIAAGISFVADMAGCAWPDRAKHYLGNLNRLGLVRFSDEPVVDFRRYYLIEAHPEAVAAMHRVKRAISVYRSIYLSVFGMQFCEEAFTLEGYDAGGWAHRDRGDLYWGKGPRLP
ncbi:Abi-alpha family protein [Antrihabitans stalactiti]|jgi:hypothetical protein|uniref:DUF4393 domain-containing protein n=1 Tax=Antrihabitans stalactiti TaxID=2584121 RepID=A0A848KRL6_9NOCA|nr:Abi-alpha family protein [Antrihabitans stalactiti]NMN98237.1 DUF4393 domain-containing protein [Antrihabitans stalactiti]